MRALGSRQVSQPRDLRRPLERLDGLPLRPASVRLTLDALPEEADPLVPGADLPGRAPRSACAEVDPGWVLASARFGPSFDPLELIAARPWWPMLSGGEHEALTRLWRHSVAVSQAARRLAKDAHDPEPERVARAALLHNLGLWAVAAVDPDWLTGWLAEPVPEARLAREYRDLGSESTTLGRRLAERWGCDPLVADAAWLHADRPGGISTSASDPAVSSSFARSMNAATRPN